MEQHYVRLQIIVFLLVATAFTNVYITQPVLPVLQQEFGVTPSQASLTMSAVIFGMALANLPFGALADIFSVRWLIFLGSLVVAGSGLFLCRHPAFLAPGGSPLAPGPLHPGDDYLSGCLSCLKHASGAAQRRHGFLCLGDRGRWSWRAAFRGL